MDGFDVDVDVVPAGQSRIWTRLPFLLIYFTCTVPPTMAWRPPALSHYLEESITIGNEGVNVDDDDRRGGRRKQ